MLRAAKGKGRVLAEIVRTHETAVYEQSGPGTFVMAVVEVWVPVFSAMKVATATGETDMWNWDPGHDCLGEVFEPGTLVPMPLRCIRGAFAAAANGTPTETQRAVVRAVAAAFDLKSVAFTERKSRSRRLAAKA
jgi:hypothetical protein